MASRYSALKWIAEHGEDLVRRRVEQKLSFPALAAVYGLHEDTMRNYAIRMGLPKVPRTRPEWPQEKIDVLVYLHTQGWSGSEIGEKMGMTRSAVLGKLHRLGLLSNGPPQRSSSSVPGRKRRRRAAEINRDRPVRPRPGKQCNTKVFKSVEIPPIPELPPPEPLMLPLMALESRSCRWPIGDPLAPSFGFCGVYVAEDGTPYCPHHTRLAQPPADLHHRGWRAVSA